MLVPTLLLATLSTLSVALPSPAAPPVYPPMKTARAFRLVFNVTNQDFPGAEAVHGTELWPRDFFGPESTRGTVVPSKTGAVFFQTPRFNGSKPGTTDEDWYRSSIQAQFGDDAFLGLIDSGPLDPSNKTVAPFRFYKGSLGSEGFQINRDGIITFLYPFEQTPWNPRLVVCDETIQFPTGPAKWKTFGYVGSRYNAMPDECVSVMVLPECDKLDKPEGKVIFEAASEVRCYEDVKSIEWAKYSW